MRKQHYFALKREPLLMLYFYYISSLNWEKSGLNLHWFTHNDYLLNTPFENDKILFTPEFGFFKSLAEIEPGQKVNFEVNDLFNGQGIVTVVNPLGYAV